jgi:transcriptional regulator with XRE-family HTH domain
MAPGSSEYAPAALSQERLKDLIEQLAAQGHSQIEIAAKAGIPPQYLSDIKRDRRPMTELVARRMGQVFEVNFEWLLGTSDNRQIASPEPGTTSAPHSLWLPLFPQPIEGEPRAHPKWDGMGLEISGLAAAKVAFGQQPYILRFGHNDHQGRLRIGDLILVSQIANPAAEISIVRHRKKSYLARANAEGIWERVVTGETLPIPCSITGHCVAIVWASLCHKPTT